MSVQDLEHRFEHEMVRADCLSLAETLNESLPDSREKALAITKIEEAMFWANAALARQPDGIDGA